MKAFMSFDLYEERESFETALNGYKYKAVLRDFYEYLRRKSKMGENHIEIEELKDELWTMMVEEGVSVYE